jgi:hypothetical protein
MIWDQFYGCNESEKQIPLFTHYLIDESEYMPSSFHFIHHVMG